MVQKPGISAEDAVYVRVLEELMVRLSLFAAENNDGKQTLRRMRREVVEAAFHEVHQHSTPGTMLAEVSSFLEKVIHASHEELAAVESRYRARNNPGMSRDHV